MTSSAGGMNSHEEDREQGEKKMKKTLSNVFSSIVSIWATRRRELVVSLTPPPPPPPPESPRKQLHNSLAVAYSYRSGVFFKSFFFWHFLYIFFSELRSARTRTPPYPCATFVLVFFISLPAAAPSETQTKKKRIIKKTPSFPAEEADT